MICYRPHDGDVSTSPVNYRTRTCFLMTQLSHPLPNQVERIIEQLRGILDLRGIDMIDANSEITGRDFLNKIWNMMYSVPLGIAVIHEDMNNKTYANIFYELGVMQALGKETVVIKTGRAEVPSDFVRTEYIEFDSSFEGKIERFLKGFDTQADYYFGMSAQLENDPLLAIDYLRRSYLISQSGEARTKAARIFEEADIQGRAKSSVEALLIRF